MATPSSVLAWRIPGMGEPGGPPSTRSHRVGHDGSDLGAAVKEHDEAIRFQLNKHLKISHIRTVIFT